MKKGILKTGEPKDEGEMQTQLVLTLNFETGKSRERLPEAKLRKT
jgi:hypothetical protein